MRSVLVVPGSGGCTHTPTLAYATAAAEARGARAHHLAWRGAAPAAPRERVPWALAQLDQAMSDLPESLVVAASLGTLAANLAVDRAWPAIWITPLLHRPEVVAAIRRAMAPCLLIGGTADSSWSPQLARDLSPHVFEIDGADHGLRVPGPLARSAAVLGAMATAVEEFLDATVWPAESDHVCREYGEHAYDQ